MIEVLAGYIIDIIFAGGFSGPDVKLMEEKIQFLSGVPRHANLVNFLGASEEENNGGKGGRFKFSLKINPSTDEK